MQPTFNPWLGYFDLIKRVDKFIILDTVQLNQQSWQTRNKIKIQDKEFMICIPIIKSEAKYNLLIKDTLIDFRKFDFRKKLLKSIEQNYTKSQHFSDTFEFIKSLILFKTEYLGEYNINIIKKVAQKLKLHTEIIILSDTNFTSSKQKGELIIDICKYFYTNEYISPIGSKDYLDKSMDNFNALNISVEYQKYNHPQYNQLDNNFIPFLGIFDLLMNEGFDNSRNILIGDNNENR